MCTAVVDEFLCELLALVHHKGRDENSTKAESDGKSFLTYPQGYFQQQYFCNEFQHCTNVQQLIITPHHCQLEGVYFLVYVWSNKSTFVYELYLNTSLLVCTVDCTAVHHNLACIVYQPMLFTSGHTASLTPPASSTLQDQIQAAMEAAIAKLAPAVPAPPFLRHYLIEGLPTS